jgi:hypothetical protein
VLIAAAIVILALTAQMPMRDTYGGVKNVWYVSPGLLPLIVGIGILVLSCVLLVHSIRTGGAADFIRSVRSHSPGISEANQRFLGIILALFSFVYLFIPRIDFVLSIALFLSYFVPAFYYDTQTDLRRLSIVYGAFVACILLLFVTGIADLLNGVFEFSTDVIVLALIVAMLVFARRIAGSDRVRRGKYRLALIVTIVTPLILTPVFRFLLYVRLPHEGGIVQLLQIIWFSIR